jgi:hypothetical protein
MDLTIPELTLLLLQARKCARYSLALCCHDAKAGWRFNDLIEQFGEQSVFTDVAAIEVGRDFRKANNESRATCGVLLAACFPSPNCEIRLARRRDRMSAGFGLLRRSCLRRLRLWRNAVHCARRRKTYSSLADEL